MYIAHHPDSCSWAGMLALENNHKINSGEAHFSKLHLELYTENGIYLTAYHLL